MFFSYFGGHFGLLAYHFEIMGISRHIVFRFKINYTSYMPALSKFCGKTAWKKHPSDLKSFYGYAAFNSPILLNTCIFSNKLLNSSNRFFFFGSSMLGQGQ